jgi:hypothetical protein
MSGEGELANCVEGDVELNVSAPSEKRWSFGQFRRSGGQLMVWKKMAMRMDTKMLLTTLVAGLAPSASALPDSSD